MKLWEHDPGWRVFLSSITLLKPAFPTQTTSPSAATQHQLTHRAERSHTVHMSLPGSYSTAWAGRGSSYSSSVWWNKPAGTGYTSTPLSYLNWSTAVGAKNVRTKVGLNYNYNVFFYIWQFLLKVPFFNTNTVCCNIEYFMVFLRNHLASPQSVGEDTEGDSHTPLAPKKLSLPWSTTKPAVFATAVSSSQQRQGKTILCAVGMLCFLLFPKIIKVDISCIFRADFLLAIDYRFISNHKNVCLNGKHTGWEKTLHWQHRVINQRKKKMQPTINKFSC